MYKLVPYFCCIAVMMSCKGKNSENSNLAYAVDSISIMQDKTAVVEKIDTALIAKEIEMYRNKISNRIAEYDDENERLRKLRTAERDKKIQEGYTTTIETNEKNKKYLQERLDEMGGRLKAGWREFKEDLERYFAKEPSGK